MKSLILATLVLSAGCATFANERNNEVGTELQSALAQSQSDQDQVAMSLRKFFSRPVKVMYADRGKSKHKAVSADGMVIRLKKIKKKT